MKTLNDRVVYAVARFLRHRGGIASHNAVCRVQ